MSECLEENEIVDFVMRNLDPGEADRVEVHIDSCTACRAVLIELARVFELRASSRLRPHDLSEDAVEDSAGPSLGLLPPELLRGTNVGRYLLLDMLGTGAMGVVFSAYDPELDRKVAVKLLRDRRPDAERNGRMVREARVTARLAHPNVVVVHDVGEFDGNVFMAMELVTGGTLGQWLDAGQRSRAAILDALIEAGEGLAAAHDEGLVHRDFKPGNVLMGDNGRPRVTDFGLARSGDTTEHTRDDFGDISGSLDDVVVTRTGALVGTPAYMSPEQFEGRIADAKSDQFSFCVALAEALSGQRPFAGQRLTELQVNVCAGRLRARALDGLPRSLQAALRRGLSVDPSGRYPDMHALLRALLRLRRSSPGRVWMRAGALAVALVGGAGAAWAGSRDVAQPAVLEACKPGAPDVDTTWAASTRDRIETKLAGFDRSAAPRIARSVVDSLDAHAQAWRVAHEDACTSPHDLGTRFAQTRCLDQARVELEAMMAVLSEGDADLLEHAEVAVRGLTDPHTCVSGSSEMTFRGPPEAIREAVDTQRVAFEVANAYLATGQYEAAIAAVEPVIEAGRRLGYAPLVLDAMWVRADALGQLGRYDAQVEALREGFSASVRAADARGQVRLASAMVSAQSEAGGDGDAAPFWLDVAESALTRLDANAPAAFDYWFAAGMFHAYRGEHERALADLERASDVPGLSFAQELSTKNGRLVVLGQTAGAQAQQQHLLEARELVQSVRVTLRPDHPRLISISQTLANALLSLGRGPEAVAALDDAMQIAFDTLAEDDQRLAGILTTRASARRVAGDLEGAQADAERAVEIREAAGNDDLALGLAYNNLAAMEVGLQDFESSIDHYARALPLLEASLGPEHINLGNMHTGLSSSLLALERFAEAREHLQIAQEIADAVGDQSARLDPIIELNLARVALGEGELVEASRWSASAYGSAVSSYGESHPILAKFLAGQARVFLARDEKSAARDALERAAALANDDGTRAVIEALRARAEPPR